METKRRLLLVWVTAAVLLSGCAAAARHESGSLDQSGLVRVTLVSRPVVKGPELVPRNPGDVHHMAIASGLLPHTIWEMGPDAEGRIATTNTVEDLSAWHTHLVTQKCLELGGKYIRLGFVRVDRKKLLAAIKRYEDSWVGKDYSRFSDNGNYAVESVIYAAGGSTIELGKPPPK